MPTSGDDRRFAQSLAEGTVTRRTVGSVRSPSAPNVSFLYCAPHTFHLGGDIAGVMDYAGRLLTHLHLADAFDHRASSGLRYIINPPWSTARIHQYLDIGQGEVNWKEFFEMLERLRFDGIMTVCVVAWEEHAAESSIFMREQVQSFTKNLVVVIRDVALRVTSLRRIIDHLHLTSIIHAIAT
jgi:myo-inositol catabolism protein IolH